MWDLNSAHPHAHTCAHTRTQSHATRTHTYANVYIHRVSQLVCKYCCPAPVNQEVHSSIARFNLVRNEHDKELEPPTAVCCTF